MEGVKIYFIASARDKSDSNACRQYATTELVTHQIDQ